VPLRRETRAKENGILMKQDDGEPKEPLESPGLDNVVFGRFGPRRIVGEEGPPLSGETEEETPAGETIREWWRNLEL
jgi:hypothetical protein